MSYDVALTKAWSEIEDRAKDRAYTIQFLADEYSVDLENKRVLSLSCNIPAKIHVSILILHYLSRRLNGLPPITGEWISFKQLEGGQGYYPAFKKRVVEPIMRKYSSNPEALLELTERFKAKRVQLADISIVLEVFDNVPVLISLWRADEEFGLDANILFDKSIKDVFCTEDIVVLAGFVATNI